MNTADYINELYRLTLGRAADEEGLRTWSRLVDETGDAKAVLEGIIASEEYRKKNTPPVLENGAKAKLAKHLLSTQYTIVDIGAQKLDFEGHIYAPITRLGIPHRIFGFEPLSEKLSQRVSAEGNQNLVMLPYAVGDGSQQTLHVTNRDSASSLFPLDVQFCRDFEDLSSLEVVEKLPVSTCTLDDALKEQTGMIDYLKLDIQGAELMALQGATRTLARTAVIHCEVEFSPIYQGQPLFSDIQAFLNKAGFELVDILVQHRYSYEVSSGTRSPDRLIWGDAVFFAQDVDDTMKISQAATAAYIYKKMTLAEHLLVRTVRPDESLSTYTTDRGTETAYV